MIMMMMMIVAIAVSKKKKKFLFLHTHKQKTYDKRRRRIHLMFQCFLSLYFFCSSLHQFSFLLFLVWFQEKKHPSLMANIYLFETKIPGNKYYDGMMVLSLVLHNNFHPYNNFPFIFFYCWLNLFFFLF